MVVRISDKKKNYSTVTKLLVKTKFNFITRYQYGLYYYLKKIELDNENIKKVI